MVMFQQFSYNDAVLLGSLLYSCVDLSLEWENFRTCSKPIHQWLLVSYGCVIVSRVTHLLGSRAAASGADLPLASGSNAEEFLLDLRHKGAIPRALATFTWTTALPFFALWTLMGTSWLWEVSAETPQCVPSVTHLWFSYFWLVLCYIWVMIHVGLGVCAFLLERRVRLAEGNLREIETDDVRRRWGMVSQISDYRVLANDVLAPGVAGGGGLSPSAIRALPCSTLGCGDRLVACGGGRECPICITEVETGDTVRCLPVCGHTFHKSCIDLWLLRRAECPLCKRHVHANSRGKQDGEWV